MIRSGLRHLGITEDLLVHEQDYSQFLEEKGLQELGRGGEGAVYFLRGHVVKVVDGAGVPAALRELAHMLHINHIVRNGATMGDRARQDFPAPLWVYVLSNGSISIGMKPFDVSDKPGSTLFDRLVCGPVMDREHVFNTIRGMAQSLVYAHKKGIIHHDLKPANIFVPGDPAQPPVVFDLGQALWNQSSWGRNWLKHQHNYCYWYNGTYRYMHMERRLAHMAALATISRVQAEPKAAQAFTHFVPSYYDDVFSFARMLRDIVQSRYMGLPAIDRVTMRLFYQKLMGLRSKRKPEKQPSPAQDSNVIKSIRSLLRSTPEPAAVPVVNVMQKYSSMEQVLPEVEELLKSLKAATQLK
jgi:serine/threonine protein kinase